MAKMKYFGTAMQIVRGSQRDSQGKVKNKNLANAIGKMLAAVRGKDFKEADSIARGIVTEYKGQTGL